jgi:hypothetical protein
MKKTKVVKIRPIKAFDDDDNRRMVVGVDVQHSLAESILDCIKTFSMIADDKNTDNPKEMLDDLYYECGRILGNMSVLAICPECGSLLDISPIESCEIMRISWMMLLKKKLILKKDLEKIDVFMIYDWINTADILFDVICNECDFSSFSMLYNGKLQGIDTSPRLVC